MEKIILVRIGEIALKGLNRGMFEKQLATNMRKAIKDCGKASIKWSQSRFYVSGGDDFDHEKAMGKLSRVFGIVSLSYTNSVDNDFDLIKDEAIEVVKKKLDSYPIDHRVTFKVESKRGLKSFPLTSPEISNKLGGIILKEFPSLKVDVHNPDFILFVEVREKSYIYADILPARGGMPVGTNGKACLLLSGGIDSPVAGYMVAKRGVRLVCVHYHSHPYTSERAKDKVLELARILTDYAGDIKVYIVPFTDIQLEINKEIDPSLNTLIMRRSMMRIAQKVALDNRCLALVTGESIGQVASQTMEALYCTNEVAKMPVFRPLIGMDKNEVVDFAKSIDTYETSILPYEDCCTIFNPKRPKTRPNLKEVIEWESHVDFTSLEEVAFKESEIIFL